MELNMIEALHLTDRDRQELGETAARQSFSMGARRALERMMLLPPADQRSLLGANGRVELLKHRMLTPLDQASELCALLMMSFPSMAREALVSIGSSRARSLCGSDRVLRAYFEQDLDSQRMAGFPLDFRQAPAPLPAAWSESAQLGLLIPMAIANGFHHSGAPLHSDELAQWGPGLSVMILPQERRLTPLGRAVFFHEERLFMELLTRAPRPRHQIHAFHGEQVWETLCRGAEMGSLLASSGEAHSARARSL